MDSPGRTAFRSSVNARVTGSPGTAGSSMKDLVNSSQSEETVNASDAFSSVAGAPSMVAEKFWVRLLYVSEAAPGGTCRVVVKVHDVCGSSAPFWKNSILPTRLKLDPVPQTSFLGRSVAVRPLRTRDRSS